MNKVMVANYLGQIMRLEGIFMIPSIIIAVFERETAVIVSFAAVAAVLFIIGMILSKIKPSNDRFYAREGFITVALSWIVISLFGCLPFVFSGAIPNFIDAFFETVSGFTTTGASILKDVETLPMSILYWRSFTNWLGGMGVLVFVLAVMPLHRNGNGASSFKILRTESTGPSVGKLVPKIKSTAIILYAIYIALTLIEMVMLLCGGMPLFDSIVNSFATAGTGGFAVKNASIGAYGYYHQTVIAVFMMLFGINFNIFYLMLIRDFKSVFKNSELRNYLLIIVASTAVITLNTCRLYDTFCDALHHGFFQVSSIITTTGFSTYNFNGWPMLSKIILVLLMIIGACAGSTGGGSKIIRMMIVGKTLKSSVTKMLHPNSVRSITVDDSPINDITLKEVFGYYAAYIAIGAVSVLLISLESLDFETTTTSVISCLNNIGPGLGEIIGPAGNYSSLSVLSKLVLSADMLIGRLEIFPILLLFNISTWKRCK